MADLITVEDPDDPRLRDYTGLTDVELRRKREPAEGLFIAEGEKVIRRAKDAGYEMRSMLLSAKWVDVMRDVIDELPAPVYAVSPELAERVTGYHVHRGALASMQRKPMPDAAELLVSARRGVVTGDRRDGAGERVAIFEGFVDHANLGAAFRSAAALGIKAILLSPDCADPLYRRAIKVSMGAVFSVPYARFDAWPAGLDVVRDAGYAILAMTPDEKATPLDELNPERYGKSAIMLGSEGHGLSTYALRAADEWVRIPMSAGVDSLNVAAASAVAFYATRPRPA
ncbi:RNA methyltransferase [Streptomyces sp. NPDC005329]|uniref:TrmH family RNA methyltransferase n=1 Tax=Streptomyces sp. NPDC005329 TaxID=3157034 RepID=UPI0033A2C8FA